VGRETARRLALAVGAPLVFLALAELVLWALDVPGERSDPAFAEMVRRVDAQELFYEVDPELFWRLAPERHIQGEAPSFETDARGLRRTRYAPGSGARSGPIVLFVGDSVTFGYGLPDGATIPDLVGRGLARRTGGAAGVINGGVPGYSSHQGRRHLRRLLEALDPGVVVLSFGFNDARALFASDAQIARAGEALLPVRRVLHHSRLYRLLRAVLRSGPELPGGTRPAVPRVDVETYARNLRAMFALVRERGAHPVWLETPFQRDTRYPYGPRWFTLHHPLPRYREAARRAADAAGVPRVDVAPLTPAHHPGNERLFLDPAHPTPEGAAIIADSVLAVLARNDLAP